MFTGIVQSLGRLTRRESRSRDQSFRITADSSFLESAIPGESIAVNGVCLTATRIDGGIFEADVSAETLEHTTLGQIQEGAGLNLEKALTLERSLGGHLVSGHVDAVGKIRDQYRDGESIRFSVEAPAELMRYIAPKGSLALDGISLTVNAVSGTRFELNIVPHTLRLTTLGAAKAGTAVNLEVDVLARYLERLLVADGDRGGGDMQQLLAERGFGTTGYNEDSDT